jgi:hypothetical protein
VFREECLGKVLSNDGKSERRRNHEDGQSPESHSKTQDKTQ